jgi:HEAT repeat protein
LLQAAVCLLAAPLVLVEIYTLSPDVRLAVLKGMSYRGAAATAWIDDALFDRDWDVCLAADRMLRELGADAVPTLRQRLQSSDATTRFRAAYALGLLMAQARDAAPDLIEAVRDPENRVRQQALSSLLSIDDQHPELLRILQAAVRDADATVRQAAAQNLGRLLPEARAVVPDLIRLLLNDPVPEVRAAAAEALGAATSDTDLVIPALRKALQDPHDCARSEAEEALEHLRGVVAKEKSPEGNDP